MSLGFEKFIARIGLTQADMDRAAASMPMPLPKRAGEAYRVQESPIHGCGVFASAPFGEGEPIAAFHVGSEWTEAGRYMNHAENPNCAVHFDGVNVQANACAPINEGEEITVNYQQVRESMTHAET